MYIEPWVRFAMRIRPKISEKPAASRNSRPPRARLFRVWMIQYCINERGRKIRPRFLLSELHDSRFLAGGESLVDRILDLRGVPAGSDDAEGFVTHVAQHRLVEGGHAADHRDLSPEAVLVELPEEAKAVRAGEAEKDAVHVGFELRDVGSVVGNGERRE